MSAIKTILIIDDEPFNVEIIKDSLEDENFSFLTAENGQSGLELLNKNKSFIDVILLDRMMPVMDGMQFLEIIKKDEEIRHIPIIMQTAASTDSDIIEGINAGAYYYLTKPFQSEVLLSIVNAAISDYTLHREINESNLSFDTVCNLINEVEFRFKNLSEAETLSKMLAKLFPHPLKVIMGITELLINSVEHGNLGITYKEKTALIKNGNWVNEINNRLTLEQYKEKFTTVNFSHNHEGIRLTIRDQGKGFDYEKYLKVDPSRAFDPHGRGIAVAAMISFDKVEFIGVGNEVHCYTNDEIDGQEKDDEPYQ